MSRASGVLESFFQRVETRRYGWSAGRPDLHWHILFDVDTIDRELVTPYHAITHRPGLAPVPARWVHMTVLHGGPIAEYWRGEIDAITERIRRRCARIEPFDLTIDRPVGGHRRRGRRTRAARPGVDRHRDGLPQSRRPMTIATRRERQETGVP